MVTHLEPDILEYEVKSALGSVTTNKASGGDGIPAKLFLILKDELFKCCTQYASKFGKLQQWSQDRKRSLFIPISKKGNAKECSNYCTIVLISHASEVKVAQSSPTLCDPMDYTVHGILQARILEWEAVHFSRGSS